MGLFDYFVPKPPVACPACGAALAGWQGKSGPCALFEWVQGQRSPVRQLVDDDAAATPAVRDQAVLPPNFELYTTCLACSTWIEALGSCEGNVWDHVDFVNPLEPPGAPDGWMPLDARDRQLMLAELEREIQPGHPLAQRKVLPLLRRRGRDDLLVRTIGVGATLWLVHLTWRAESDPRWPRVESFPNLAAFAKSQAD